jgi:hypothetical protein
MKLKIQNKIFLALTLILGLVSCQERDMVMIDNQDSPMALDLSTDKLFLDKNFPENPALTITWSAATYTVPTAVKYKVEVASEDEFLKPVLLATATSPDNFKTLTAKQMNEASKAIGLLPDVAAKMYIRVTFFLGDNVLASNSKVTNLMITPYVLTYPDFYLVGAACYVGWSAADSQILYKKENKSYIYTYLEKDANFRFLGQRDWNPKNFALNTEGTNASNKYFLNWTPNFEKPDGDNENIKFTGNTGIYKIEINAEAGVQTISAVASPVVGFDFPEIYLVGNIEGNNWKPENGIAMSTLGNGVYEYTTSLATDTEFKILGQKSFGALEWANIDKDNAGNSGFLGPKDDNGNIKFVGDGTSHKITVNLKAGTYKIVKL